MTDESEKPTYEELQSQVENLSLELETMRSDAEDNEALFERYQKRCAELDAATKDVARLLAGQALPTYEDMKMKIWGLEQKLQSAQRDLQSANASVDETYLGRYEAEAKKLRRQLKRLLLVEPEHWAVRLRWTTKPPTAPGWYWWRPKKIKKSQAVLFPAVVKVTPSEVDGERAGEWAGPIPPPYSDP